MFEALLYKLYIIIIIHETQPSVQVSFTKEGKRCYRVQWKSTWESEEDLLVICKDVLRNYWEEQSQHVIVDQYASPRKILCPGGEVK